MKMRTTSVAINAITVREMGEMKSYERPSSPRGRLYVYASSAVRV